MVLTASKSEAMLITASSPTSVTTTFNDIAPVFVPDDFDGCRGEGSSAPPVRKGRRPSALLRQFSRIDAFMSPDRLKHEAEAAKWHNAVSTKIAETQISPTRLHEILDDPLMAQDVGRHAPRRSPATKLGLKSPGARLKAAIAAAVRSDQRSKRTYLVKAEPPPARGRASAATKLKTPPVWRRSPRALAQILTERNRAAEAAPKPSRWASAVRQSVGATDHSPAQAKASPRHMKRAVSWAALAPAASEVDALDQFMQRPGGGSLETLAPAVAPPKASDLAALCRARRREVLLEMGMEETELHPSLRGYAPRREAQSAAVAVGGDALDAFMGS